MTNPLKTVPDFPNWRKFVPEDQGWYEVFYITNLMPYAEPSPINIRSWVMANDDLQIAKIDKLLVMQFRNILDENKPTFFLLGQEINAYALKKTFAYQSLYNLPAKVSYIPLTLLSSIDPSEFNIDKQRDDAEYLFSCRDHLELEGPAFYKLRQQVSCFKRIHSQDKLEINHINSLKEYRKNIDFILKNWKLATNNSPINYEGKILKKIAAIGDYSKIKMLTLSINNQLASAVIYSTYDKIAIIQHIKVDYSFDRLFGYTSHILAQELHNQGVQFINYEQDLGLEGLRQYKNRLRPVKLLEKASVTPAHPLN